MGYTRNAQTTDKKADQSASKGKKIIVSFGSL
jgi:hypothetical protein